MLVTSPVLILGLSTDSTVAVVAGIALIAVAVIAMSVLGAALSGVFRTALYRYAVLGEEPTGFSHEQITEAFRPKRSRRGLV